MSKTLLRLVVFSCLFALGTLSALGQDFNRTYNLSAGGTVAIRNVSGDVEVRGYVGAQVVVQATREGRDSQIIDIEDTSGGNSIDIRVRYPRDCRNCEASVRFVVQVPRTLRLTFSPISSASGNIRLEGVNGDVKASTASGDVTISNVSGEINASSASGDVHVGDVAGTVNASTASGDVEVEIARLEGAENMKFSSASGNVSVRVPSSLDAEVSMSTLSGSVNTNFPIEVQESKYGPGRKAQGRLGSGSRSLRISTVSGNVSLLSN